MQAISNFRANLSNEDSQTNGLYNDDQNILAAGTNNSIICPSNGYTFPRTTAQVRSGFRRQHSGLDACT